MSDHVLINMKELGSKEGTVRRGKCPVCGKELTLSHSGWANGAAIHFLPNHHYNDEKYCSGSGTYLKEIRSV